VPCIACAPLSRALGSAYEFFLLLPPPTTFKKNTRRHLTNEHIFRLKISAVASIASHLRQISAGQELPTTPGQP
jgi:hypothetical protein